MRRVRSRNFTVLILKGWNFHCTFWETVEQKFQNEQKEREKKTLFPFKTKKLKNNYYIHSYQCSF